MASKKVKIAIGVGVVAVAAMLIIKAKKSALPNQNELRAKSYLVPGQTVPMTGERLNVRVQPDGSILIGDGYQGRLVATGIETFARNGVSEGARVWRFAA